MMNSALRLDDLRVSTTLNRLHAKARDDKWIFLRALPSVAWSLMNGRTAFDGALPHLKDAYIPVDAEQGQFLYVTARAIRARTIVEFGTSFGISTIYLAAAARAASGRVIGTELEPQKVKAARANVAQAGLAQFVDIREGDAMETLAHLKETIDFLLLDGLKDIYLPMIKMLAPKMRAGSVVVADDIFTFKTALAPYLRHMKNTENGFESVTLPIGYGMEYSIRLGG